jgi:hypothetical protein
MKTHTSIASQNWIIGSATSPESGTIAAISRFAGDSGVAAAIAAFPEIAKAIFAAAEGDAAALKTILSAPSPLGTLTQTEWDPATGRCGTRPTTVKDLLANHIAPRAWVAVQTNA